MKKSVFIFAIFMALLLIIQLTLAQEAQASSGTTAKDKLKQGTKNFQQKSNKILTEDKLSPVIQKTIELIFKTHKDKITLSDLIILITAFIMVFIIIGDSAGLFFEKKWIAWTIGFLVTALGSMTGGLAYILSLINGFVNMFKFLSTWSVGALIFTILIVGIPTIIIMKLLKKFKLAQEEAKAKQTAEKIGEETALSQVTRKSFEQTADINKDLMKGFE
jgi:flagellar biosynthesis/type III secretory pathway M-ring protein FliF/YscJ